MLNMINSGEKLLEIDQDSINSKDNTQKDTQDLEKLFLGEFAERYQVIPELHPDDTSANVGYIRNDNGHICTLRLRGCFIQELPDSIKHLRHIVSLDLNNNEIRTFPEVLFSFPTLQSLSLKFNLLKKLPIKISELQSLSKLSVDYNLIEGRDIEKITKRTRNIEISYQYNEKSYNGENERFFTRIKEKIKYRKKRSYFKISKKILSRKSIALFVFFLSFFSILLNIPIVKQTAAAPTALL